MKTLPKAVLYVLTLGLIISSVPSLTSAQRASSFQLFYDNLSPYGEWVDNPEYGYVWIPDVAEGFSPYGSNGSWIYTDAGWTWLSYYVWGWAPFHYGSWYFDAHYGYAWIPGEAWSPGWVTWRSSADCYGWAPMGPGISLGVSNSRWHQQPFNEWRFVRKGDLGRNNISWYYLYTAEYMNLLSQSFIILNNQDEGKEELPYNTGPGRAEVETYTGFPIFPVLLLPRSTPGHGLGKDGLRLYRPWIENRTDSQQSSSPAKIIGWNNGRPQIISRIRLAHQGSHAISLKERPEITESSYFTKPPRLPDELQPF